MPYKNYLKINALIFEIDVAPENEKYDNIELFKIIANIANYNKFFLSI